MGFFYDENLVKVKWMNVFVCLVLIIVIFSMIKPFKVEWNKGIEQMNLCIQECVRDVLDNFDSCIDLGTEETGFLSSEHYYLCDGIKTSNSCLEWEELNNTCKRSMGKKITKNNKEEQKQ